MCRPGALLLGEASTINGHSVARVGLAGCAAYLVDGFPLSLEGAVATVATPSPDPCPAAPLALASAPPRRARAAERPVARAPSKPVPELLAETRAVLRGERGATFQHRVFAEGEAVTVHIDVSADAPERVIARLRGSGLYAEMGSGRSVVVAWTKAVLSGETTMKGKR